MSQTLARADQAYQSGHWDSAIESYHQVLSEERENATACLRLADALSIRGRLRDALDTYLRLFEICESQGDMQAALEAAQMARNLQPHNEQARVRIVAALMITGDKAEALRETRELAHLYSELHQGDQAISLMQQAERLAPDNLEVVLEMAEMWFTQGHISEAGGHFRKVIAMALQAENFDIAIQALRRLKVVNHTDVAVPLQLADLLMRLSRFDEAELEYRASLRLNVSDTRALFGLGNCCQAKGQYRDAILAFNRMIQLNPDQVVAREKLGELYEIQGMMSDAANFYVSAAQHHSEHGEAGLAIELFQKVLELQPDHAIAAHHLARLGATAH